MNKFVAAIVAALGVVTVDAQYVVVNQTFADVACKNISAISYSSSSTGDCTTYRTTNAVSANNTCTFNSQGTGNKVVCLAENFSDNDAIYPTSYLNSASPSVFAQAYFDQSNSTCAMADLDSSFGQFSVPFFNQCVNGYQYSCTSGAVSATTCPGGVSANTANTTAGCRAVPNVSTEYTAAVCAVVNVTSCTSGNQWMLVSYSSSGTPLQNCFTDADTTNYANSANFSSNNAAYTSMYATTTTDTATATTMATTMATTAATTVPSATYNVSTPAGTTTTTTTPSSTQTSAAGRVIPIMTSISALFGLFFA